MKIIKFKSKYYKKINDIYKNSFPKEERYISLNKMIKFKDSELYCLEENDNILGIIYLIKYKSSIFVLYLAINQKMRSKGYGSYLLKWCLEKYNNFTIYLNIEEVNKNKSDYEIRKKRQKFYLQNGFNLTNLISRENIENFEVLSNKKEIDIEEYIELDKFIAKFLNEPISDIVRK